MVYSVPNWIDGVECPAVGAQELDKRSPHSGDVIGRIARSGAPDVDRAVAAAVKAAPAWASMPAVQRGFILHKVCNLLEQRQAEMARMVALETGKTPAESLGETGGAVALGRFYAGEGQRLYGRTTTSSVVAKQNMTFRQPCGVAALIIAANTPIANVAWKVFPALICGNTVVLKAAEDTPGTALLFGQIAAEAGLPAGTLNILQGLGEECGMPLVEHDHVDVVSFTGSTRVGRLIGEACGKRLRKVSLELGGKNPLLVCDDADLDNAVRWTCLSAFSNAGQRCAAGSRILVFESVYDEFVKRLLAATAKLKVGDQDGDDFGPVINERQLRAMLGAIERAKADGATILAGGHRLTGSGHAGGYYLAPTVIANADPEAEISKHELFGPIACLYPVRDFTHGLAMANESPYGLTASIHSRSIDRAMTFADQVKSGVAVVNAGTYGSEPHLPFGGRRNSGNGSREPGTEALDIYSELKNVYLQIRPDQA